MTKLLPLALMIAAVLAIGAGPAHAGRSVTTAPAARWVKPVDVALDQPTPSSAVSVFTLLVDEQRRASGKSSSLYWHVVQRILTREGVSASSTVEAVFDPSYQRAVLHHVRVIRDGQARDVLNAASLRAAFVQADAEAGTYDGRQRVTFLVPDVRIGDTIDFAYTIEGANPVFGKRTFGAVTMSRVYPTAHRRARLLVPAGTTLQIHKPDGVAQGRSDAPRGYDEYWFERRDIDGDEYDVRLPAWRDQSYTVRYSDFQSWDDVALWASSVFRRATASDAAIRALAEEIRVGHDTELAQLRAALRFVQDEIRYVAIEMGENSHRPHEASAVLAQRFGDCKDKAVLLTSILDQLGIEAAPALVNTDLGMVLPTLVPSPYAFDHVVVRARLMQPDGLHELWLDPTVTAERGPIVELPYHYGLLTVALSGGLLAIPFPELEEPALDIEETFRLEAPGRTTTLEIVTRMRGSEANAMRRRLGWQSREDVAKGYLSFYQERFEELVSARPTEFEDDQDANVVTVREHYRITDFWVDNARDLTVSEVTQHLTRPTGEPPRASLALQHPVHARHTVRAWQTMGAIPAEPVHFAKDTPEFAYLIDVRTEGKELVVEASYRSRAAEVPQERVSQHLEAIDESLDHSVYPLSWGTPSLAGVGGFYPNWGVFGALGVLLLVGLVWRITRTPRPAVVRYMPPPPPPVRYQPPAPPAAPPADPPADG